jgi:hypothetical protein
MIETYRHFSGMTDSEIIFFKNLACNSLAMFSGRPPEIDCNHHEVGIFKIRINQIASLSDPHKLRGGYFS